VVVLLNWVSTCLLGGTRGTVVQGLYRGT